MVGSSKFILQQQQEQRGSNKSQSRANMDQEQKNLIKLEAIIIKIL